jgi:hypothetical protein
MRVIFMGFLLGQLFAADVSGPLLKALAPRS